MFATLIQTIWKQYADFRYQPTAGSLLLLQITEPISSGKCGKIISHECEWISAINYLLRVPYGHESSTYFGLSR
jgi:hypothetical protein